VKQLEQAGVAARSLNGESAYLADQVGLALDQGAVPVVDFSRSADRVTRLEQLLGHLQTRKMALLRAAGGVGPKERGLLKLTDSHQLVLSDRGISVINLRSDYQLLEQGAVLDDDERDLLRLVKRLQDACPSLSTSITSPLNLLSELFSVKGAGTLVKTGSTIARLESCAEFDLPRVEQLLERTFSRKLRSDFWHRPLLHVYIERDYRGAAVVQPGPSAYPDIAFLTKFAVERAAQGEGMGRDLWEAVTRDYPSMYWRSRVDNPVLPWYQAQCEGMQREVGPQGAEWQIFWRGVSTDRLSTVISDALNRPVDFEPQLPSEAQT
jgi:acetylglutamate kinase